MLVSKQQRHRAASLQPPKQLRLPTPVFHQPNTIRNVFQQLTHNINTYDTGNIGTCDTGNNNNTNNTNKDAKQTNIQIKYIKEESTSITLQPKWITTSVADIKATPQPTSDYANYTPAQQLQERERRTESIRKEIEKYKLSIQIKEQTAKTIQDCIPIQLSSPFQYQPPNHYHKSQNCHQPTHQRIDTPIQSLVNLNHAEQLKYFRQNGSVKQFRQTQDLKQFKQTHSLNNQQTVFSQGNQTQALVNKGSTHNQNRVRESSKHKQQTYNRLRHVPLERRLDAMNRALEQSKQSRRSTSKPRQSSVKWGDGSDRQWWLRGSVRGSPFDCINLYH